MSESRWPDDRACSLCGQRPAVPRPPYHCAVCLGEMDPPPPHGGMVREDPDPFALDDAVRRMEMIKED